MGEPNGTLPTGAEGDLDVRSPSDDTARSAEPPGAQQIEGAPPTARDGPHASQLGAMPGVGEPLVGPLRGAWRQGTATRAREFEALGNWFVPPDRRHGDEPRTALFDSLQDHLRAAREAANHKRRYRDGALLQRALSNLDAAEADLLQLAPDDYVIGQLPNIVHHVQRHLGESDPRRATIERIAHEVREAPARADRRDDDDRLTKEQLVDRYRQSIAAIHRGASSAALREQTQVRSFRNVTLVAAGVMTVVAAGLVLLGIVRPNALPLCFAPQSGTEFAVVCPAEQSRAFPIDGEPESDDALIVGITDATVSDIDTALVALVGLTAASIAAAAALRGIRGTSEPHGVPIALAVLKLPTGAVTAVLGLLLMRGEFVPGLSALDSSAQIIAWAAIFGYAQQLFTRLVDQQADNVMNSVRSQSPTSKSPDA